MGPIPRQGQATAVPLMALECPGAHDQDAPCRSGFDGHNGCNSRGGVVPPVSCSATLTTGSRSTTAGVIDALPIYKRGMDTATTRKRGSPGTISRAVGVTSIRRRRSGVTRQYPAPLWNSGRRSAPPIDCHSLHLSMRQHVAAVGQCVTTLCKSEDGLRQQLALSHRYHIFACYMPAYTSPCRSLSPPTATARLSGGSPVRQPWRPG